MQEDIVKNTKSIATSTGILAGITIGGLIAIVIAVNSASGN